MSENGHTAGARARELRQVIDAPPTRIVVVGGGMGGLVVARECARPGFEVTVLEASPRIGGSVAPLHVDGLILDAGAESFATRGGQVAELIDALGLAGDVVQPNAAGAWVRHGSRSVPLPQAGLLGIPSSPLARDVVAAIGWGGALRAYLDRLKPVLTVGREQRLDALVRSRMGRKVLDLLVAPVVTGVYAAAPHDLDVEAVAPGLNAAVTRLGSLSGAVGELRTSDKAGSAVGGIRGGLWRLPVALAAEIEARGGTIRVEAPVVAVEPWRAPAETPGTEENRQEHTVEKTTVADALAGRPARWIVRMADGGEFEADVVVIATSAAPALAVFETAHPALAELGALEWPTASSVELVTLVLTDDRLAAAPQGTGVLVADTADADVSAKALTHSSIKWAWVAEAAGAGRHVIRLSYGRPGRPVESRELNDDELRELALNDASRLLNIPLRASDIAGFARTLWTNALPSATVGQWDRIQHVREVVESVEGVEVTGSWLAGTGLASVVPDAVRAAANARGLRWKALTYKP